MEEEKKQARNKALRLLAARNIPSQLLCRKLIMKGFSESIAHETVKWAEELGYVNDDEYIRAVIRQELERGHGKRAILWKLRSKGFSEEAVEKEMKESLPRSLQKETLIKTMAKLHLSKPSDRKKIVTALLRRGFAMDLIYEVIPNMLQKSVFGDVGSHCL